MGQDDPDAGGNLVQQRDGGSRQLGPQISHDKGDAAQQDNHRQGGCQDPVQLFAAENLPVIQQVVTAEKADQDVQRVGDEHSDKQGRTGLQQLLPGKHEPVDQQKEHKRP